uniref:Olfactory receptor 13G1-like n=1 Tax=Geotrypetes seraphini TaxID=260995 RepID=A0A6P8NIF9_GEOSA|nr:olfactory receptor 13G1-like [Geotrypetes seraphini]
MTSLMFEVEPRWQQVDLLWSSFACNITPWPAQMIAFLAANQPIILAPGVLPVNRNSSGQNHTPSRRDKLQTNRVKILDVMKGNNQSMPIEFDMIGLSSHPELQPLFFTIFFVVYIAALVGNVAITTIIASDSRLHTPMYFFLINLSILDICCTTAAIPKVLQIIQSKKKTVSFPECITQLCIFSTALSAELILLTVMACDRYVAICIPLHYSTIMNRNTCILLAVAVWFLGFLNAIVHTGLILRLKFCKYNIIDHFFCELPSVLKAACSDTHINNMAVIIADVFLGMACFILTSLSYTHIISTILKIRSAEKKKKAFSTCASHITVVTLFYGGVIYTYVRPGFNYILEADKVMSAFYTIASPVLNPIIYSLRNKEITLQIRKLNYFCLYIYKCLIIIQEEIMNKHKSQ